MKRVIVCCGAGCATSSLLEEELKDIFNNYDIQGKVTKCLISELPTVLQMDHYDLIVPSGKYQIDTDVPVINGFNFITGINKQKTIDKIVEELRK